MRRVLIASALLTLLLSAGVARPQNGPERWLAVEVTDEGGRPLGQACVTFVPKEGEIVFRKADSRGRVRLKKPAAGSYRVVVKVDGYEAQKREVVLGEGGETVAFSLRPRAN